MFVIHKNRISPQFFITDKNKREDRHAVDMEFFNLNGLPGFDHEQEHG